MVFFFADSDVANVAERAAHCAYLSLSDIPGRYPARLLCYTHPTAAAAAGARFSRWTGYFSPVCLSACQWYLSVCLVRNASDVVVCLSVRCQMICLSVCLSFCVCLSVLPGIPVIWFALSLSLSITLSINPSIYLPASLSVCLIHLSIISMMHTKLHLINPGCPRPSKALQCSIVA